MAIRKFIGGVANVDIFVGDQLAITAKTLSDSSFTIGNTAEEVRGGQGNQLFAKYYHTSTFDIALTDVVFNLEYLAYQTGSTINVGADLFGVEQVIITGNKGQIASVPLDVDNLGLIGWVSVVGDDTWQKVTFVENAGKYEFDYTAADGTAVCVKYVSKDMQGKSITISSNMIPSEVKLVMTANEFKAGKSNDLSDSSKIGELQIVVPRFQFSGSMEISMTASGVANSPLEGSALAVEDPNCEANAGYYAIVNEKIFGEDVFADVIALVVDGANDMQLTVGTPKTAEVYAVRKMGSPFIVDNSLCTFTSSAPNIVTAGENTGVLTGVANGSATVTVVLTDKPDIETVINVTVSGGSEPVQPTTISVEVPSVAMLGKQASDLQTGLTFTEQSDVTNIKATGELKKVTGWTEFSSNPEEQTGYYLPFGVAGSPADYVGFKGTQGTYTPFDSDMAAVVFMGATGEHKSIEIKKTDGTVYTIDTTALTFAS